MPNCETRTKVTTCQLRAARALLRWRTLDVAAASMVGVATIRRAESRTGYTRMIPANERAVIEAFERAGVEFIDSDAHGGPGVRLRTSSIREQAGAPA